MALLLEFSKNLGTTLVVVTHDRILAEKGDRTLEIADGQMAEENPGLATEVD
jgi:predicted ABC-type transport system involved in lysophospholipase L1 biosynthesis ATPase subunit